MHSDTYSFFALRTGRGAAGADRETRVPGGPLGAWLIDRDDAWGGRMLGPEGLAEETLGGLCVARLTEQKIDGLAGRIDRQVEVIPLLLDLNVCLIDAV